MNAKEQQLTDLTVDAQTIRMKVRTRTRIDVGLWWRRKPAWLVITDRMLVVLSISRRKYVEKLPLASCQNIHYSPSGGELVISSQPEFRFSRLKMPPSKALEVINLIKQIKS